MTLSSFEVLPRGEQGWTSGPLHFGKNTTLLLGANGAGKTPILKSLAFVLGQPVQLPPLIREKCSGARLVLIHNQRKIVIERYYDDGVASLDDGNRGTKIIGDKELAEVLMPLLGIGPRSLAGKDNQVKPPYLGIVGPMFVVDQDSGWSNSYVPAETQQFIKDQREEVLRWMLDLPARNRVVDKSEYDTALVVQASIQHQIRIKRDAIAALEEKLKEDRAPNALELLVSRKEQADTQFRTAFDLINSVGQSTADVDIRARQVAESRQEISFKVVNLKRRRSQLAGVQAELGAEIGALEQNETAAEAFRMFCGNSACQLLRKPDESYGRRTLYLKDQLKDFASNAGEVEREIDVLEEQLAAIELELEGLAVQRKQRLAESGASGALETLQAIAREVTDLQSRIDAINRVASARVELEELLKTEQWASDRVNDLKPTRGPNKPQGRVLDARALLAQAFSEWVRVLNTPNVPADIAFDEELRLVIGAEPFGAQSSQSGSTRTRLVLAFHAAVFETSLKMDGNHPALLILDAPRQHELSAADLRAFVKHFCLAARREKQVTPQLVFSASDKEVIPEGCIDNTWVPRFTFGDKIRFLGPVAELNERD